MPGVHHVEARVFKDLFLRFKTMQGYHVARKAGWDCHGLPVEVAVEQELGLSGKKEIEAYGVAEFNARCRESVLQHVDAFEELTERMGYWVDLSQAYRTMDPDYIESVWWSLKVIFDKGLLIKDYRISPYCPRCGTPLSDHELGQPGGYETVTDPSVTVRFPLLSLPEGAHPALKGADLLVWTTTPWTLVANTAVAVHPDVTYVVARRTGSDDSVVVAEPLFAKVLGEGWYIAARVTGADLAGATYARPFGIIDIPDAHRVVTADFVTTEDGTGLVHLAPAFGADDLATSRLHGLPVVNPVGPDGRFSPDIPLVGGMFFKDADARLVTDLTDRGLAFRVATHEHSYPHCWRCHTPLLYYALPSWYIKTTAVKDKLLEENERTNWHPPTIKHGRFGEWLRNNVDWALSRSRYWGTPLPLWECADGHMTCIGSLTELSAHAGRDLSGLDPHRPYVDDVSFGCPECGRRGPAGARGNRRVVRLGFDAVRAVGRAAPRHGRVQEGVSGPVHLRGDRPDPGLVLLADGRRHHRVRPVVLRERSLPWPDRRRGRAQDEQASRQRARTHPAHGRARRRRAAVVHDGERLTVGGAQGRARRARGDRPQGPAHLLEHRCRSWCSTRTPPRPRATPGVRAGSARRHRPRERPLLDRWALSELHAAVADVTAALDDFDTARAGRRIADFIDDLSNWYVRRSRRRFWEGPAGTGQRRGVRHAARVPGDAHHADGTDDAVSSPTTSGTYCARRTRPSPSTCRHGRHPDESLIDQRLTAQMALTRRLVELGRAARAAVLGAHPPAARPRDRGRAERRRVRRPAGAAA